MLSAKGTNYYGLSHVFRKAHHGSDKVQSLILGLETMERSKRLLYAVSLRWTNSSDLSIPSLTIVPENRSTIILKPILTSLIK